MNTTETSGYSQVLSGGRDLPIGRIEYQQPQFRPPEPITRDLRELLPLQLAPVVPWKKVTKVKRLHPDAQMPTRPHPDDVGWDVYAIRDQVLQPHESTVVDTGIAIQPPPGKWYQGETRSSQAKIACCIFGGIIDTSFRGELKALLYNGGDQCYWIHKGDRIMQLVERDAPECDMVQAEELDGSARGERGLGSTGR